MKYRLDFYLKSNSNMREDVGLFLYRFSLEIDTEQAFATEKVKILL